jgi:hypothetical protein
MDIELLLILCDRESLDLNFEWPINACSSKKVFLTLKRMTSETCIMDVYF